MSASSLQHALLVRDDRAPVVTHDSPRQTASLAAYIKTMQQDGCLGSTVAESRRLQPYFDAAARFLQAEAAGHPRLLRLATPQRLHDIFNDFAAVTRNTLVSDVVVAPLGIFTKPAIAEMLDEHAFNRNYFSQQYMISHDIMALGTALPFRFGFGQVFEKAPGAPMSDARSSTTFSVLLLAERPMAHIRDAGFTQIYKPLQDVISAVNHDALHHLTSPIITGIVAPNFRPREFLPTMQWVGNLFKGDLRAPHYYEEWAHITQQAILNHPANAATVDKLQNHVDCYFDGLEAYAAARKGNMPETVNYFGMVMAHALSRAFPLDHPLVDHCLARLEKADPHPADALHRQMWWEEKRPPFVFDSDDWPAKVMDSYLRRGMEDPENSDEISFKTYKRLQLIDMSVMDTIAHAPGVSPEREKLHAKAAVNMLQMLNAAARTPKAGV